MIWHGRKKGKILKMKRGTHPSKSLKVDLCYPASSF